MKRLIVDVHERFFKLYDEEIVAKKKDSSGDAEATSSAAATAAAAAAAAAAPAAVVLPSTKTLLTTSRRRVFHGLTLLFSGVFPRNDAKARHRVLHLGKSGGQTWQRQFNLQKEKKSLYFSHFILH